MRRCLRLVLIGLLLAGCAGVRGEAENLEQPVPSLPAQAGPEQHSEPKAEPETQTRSEPEPQSQPVEEDSTSETGESQPPVSSILGENIVLIDPPLEVEYAFELDVFGDLIVRFGSEGGVLTVDRYDPLRAESLPRLEICELGDEELLDVSNREDCLVVSTDRAAYRFDRDYALVGRVELPLELLDDEIRLDYYRKSFLVNNALTEMVYRTESGLYAVALTPGAQPRLLEEHLNFPSDDITVQLYVPCAFLNDQDVLIAAGGYEWWGDFATIRLDTGEMRPLFEGSNPFGAMLYGADGALAVGEGEMVRFLDYSDSSLTDVPFIAKTDLQSFFYEGNYLFWGMHWFALRHLEDGWENITHTFHRVDYRQGIVEDLPLTVEADVVKIVWAQGGDVLFWYTISEYSQEEQTGYALARSAM